jgi:hypothetical protein
MLSSKLCSEAQKDILCSICMEKICIYEKNKKYGRNDQDTVGNIIWRIRFKCWITNSTNTHSEYLTLIAFRHLQLLSERTSGLSYTFIVSLLAVFIGI